MYDKKERNKEILELVLEGYTIASVARVYNVSRQTVYVIINKAYKAIYEPDNKRYKKQGFPCQTLN